MPRERANSVSSVAREPTVQIVFIASASPFVLMSITLMPSKSCCSSSDFLSPHLSLTRSGMSSRRRCILVASNDLTRARGRNERNSAPAEDGHCHKTFTCTQVRYAALSSESDVDTRVPLSAWHPGASPPPKPGKFAKDGEQSTPQLAMRIDSRKISKFR